jgi:hypothetical protein
VRVCGARKVLGRRPQRPGRDANATSRSRRGGGRARRGRGAGVARLGPRQQHGLGSAGGVHARARCLAAQDRGAAVPCAGHRHPGPAARRGGGKGDGGSGGLKRRVGLLQEEGGTAAGKGAGVPKACYGRFIGSAGSNGGRKGRR